ncbi:unannotated protein [freshwater metagenome]|uniref:Unannotated protein n=1 Tax=freshwater metagenome TaxID=449393 RepID=A0A6J7BJ53_9ZZZZ
MVGAGVTIAHGPEGAATGLATGLAVVFVTGFGAGLLAAKAPGAKATEAMSALAAILERVLVLSM